METTRLIPGHVHPKAIMMAGSHVQMGVTVGARTRVWQFASLIRKAVIGEDCRIAAYAIVDGARIGHRTIICHSAFLNPGVYIGNDAFVGPFVSTCNDAWPRAHKVGFDVDEFLMNGEATTRILDGASLCSHVTVLPGIIVGEGAMVSAGAVVTQNVPARCLYKRSGEIVPIDEFREKEVARMRFL